MHRFLDYARLLRLPNVFTAMADIVLGALACGALPERWRAFVWLLLASSCLYCSGMVWNDVFDVAEDRRDRPFRPLASGRISLASAMTLGALLMAGGVASAFMADLSLGVGWHAGLIALVLAGTILLYDGVAKGTLLGPVAMGSCRLLNVHLGLAAAGVWPELWGWVLAGVVGLYILGVTWFARTETEKSNSFMLGMGAGIMAAALGLALTLPALLQYFQTGQHSSWLFPYLLVGFGFYLGLALVRAVRQPSPKNVQAGVKRAILGLVLLDATLATAFVGIVGLLLALLLAPAQWLGKWVYST
jgi:4-hydroxybenzoate polyprenyltransferase